MQILSLQLHLRYSVQRTGLPTKDETVKTTSNSLNMIITWRNEVFCFENSMFNAFLIILQRKKQVYSELQGIANLRKQTVQIPYSRL